MEKVKKKMKELIESQPDDATYEEILRELTFERMVERGLEDSREDRVNQMRKWSIESAHGRDKMDG